MQRLSENKYLTKEHCKQLFKHKILTVSDFIQCDLRKISEFCGLTTNTVLKVYHHFIDEYSSEPQSAGDVFLRNQSLKPLSSSLDSLDQYLNGGLPPGTIFEFCGPSGAGKTQLSIFFTVSALVTDTDCKVCFIDTKGDFSALRARQVAMKMKKETKINSLLRRLDVIAGANVFELMSALNMVKDQLSKGGMLGLRLLVIDSVTVPFLPFIGLGSTKHIGFMNFIGQMLKEIANKHSVCIIVTNLATTYSEDETRNSGEKVEQALKPGLGKYWVHVPDTRLLIRRSTELNECDKNSRLLSVMKSSYLPPGGILELLINDWGGFMDKAKGA